MPLGRIHKSNATLYTLFTFVLLFVIATVLAIFCYVKAEGHKAKAMTLQQQMREIATSSQRQSMGAIVGEKQSGKSRIGTLVDYIDEMVSLITGDAPGDGSAEGKLDNVKNRAKEITGRLGNDAAATGLIRVIEKLNAKLENAAKAQLESKKRLEDLKKRFDDAMAAGFEKEQVLLAEKEKYQQQINDIAEDYDKLKVLLKKTSEQQVQALMAQVDEERDSSRLLKQKLLKTQAELKVAQDRMNHIRQQLQKLVPPPDSEVTVFRPDGKIILIDEKNKTVHLDLGSDDHVYPGLTFSVYDKTVPIPKDGKGKAEIEIFNIGKKISAARILHLEDKKTIILEDIVANLIWDSEKENVFAVAGGFDINNDGHIDSDAIDRITKLIEKWGGRVEKEITIDMDYVVLGKAPKLLRKPTFEEMELDPMAIEKYEASVRKLNHYKGLQNSANELGIPLLNYERFMYLIGAKSLSGQLADF